MGAKRKFVGSGTFLSERLVDWLYFMQYQYCIITKILFQPHSKNMGSVFCRTGFTGRTRHVARSAESEMDRIRFLQDHLFLQYPRYAANRKFCHSNAIKRHRQSFLEHQCRRTVLPVRTFTTDNLRSIRRTQHFCMAVNLSSRMATQFLYQHHFWRSSCRD